MIRYLSVNDFMRLRGWDERKSPFNCPDRLTLDLDGMVFINASELWDLL
jgi:hypothetical protein